LLLTEVPNKKIEIFSWLDVLGNIRNVYIGWVAGDGLARKVIVQNCGRAQMKPKN